MKKTMQLQTHCKSENLSSTKLPHKYVVIEKRPFYLKSRSAIFIVMLSVAVSLTSCSKEKADEVKAEEINTTMNKENSNTNARCRNGNYNLNPRTAWELEQARTATAKYRNIQNAINDGYTNINVDVENMGHHYMKSSLVDATFDIRHPEILVYHENDNGNMELGAVEYAVPLSQPAPQGFTGSQDVWNGSTEFQLWLLHAWVWTYNPDGVFNPNNPLVHIH